MNEWMVSEQACKPTGSQRETLEGVKIEADELVRARVPLNGGCLSFIVAAAGACCCYLGFQEIGCDASSSNHDNCPLSQREKLEDNGNAASNNNDNDNNNKHNSKLVIGRSNNNNRISSSRHSQVKTIVSITKKRGRSGSGSGSQVDGQNAVGNKRETGEEAQNGLLLLRVDPSSCRPQLDIEEALEITNNTGEFHHHHHHQSVRHDGRPFTSLDYVYLQETRRPSKTKHWLTKINSTPKSCSLDHNDNKQDKDLNAYTCRQFNNHPHYRWPPHLIGRATSRPLIPLLLLLFIGLLLSFGNPIRPASGHQSHWNPLSTKRVLRQISAPASSYNWRNSNGQQLSGGNQLNVPYKTFYVTRACEWKSNLFVPKSNDIHFAQPIVQSASSAAADHQQRQSQQSQATGSELSSSVTYETFNGANNNNNNANSNYARSSGVLGSQFQQQDGGGGSRTMLNTDSKALILALPIVMGQSFAGYESACSIRLIVPRNMRILAKLTSRRLTFDQQQLEQPQLEQQYQPDNNLDNNYEQGLLMNQQQRHQPPSLWLNVSQNSFIETEQRIIETEGNVLAFRFLLERFASKQIPDIRFQVVLTAFQTLSENSDLNGASQTSSSSSSRPSMEPNAQFICDQQRLISANLACDGFRNCQDGQDEELATCLSLRASQTPSDGIINNDPQPPTIRDQTSSTHQMIDQQLATGSGAANQAEAPIWVRTWHYVRDTNSLAGFFVGFLVVLALLTCCSCCTFLVYMLYQHRWRPYRQRQRRRNELAAAGREADHLAASQNNENAARQRLGSGPATGKQPGPLPPRLQSILKRPAEPPPAIPERQNRSGLPASQAAAAAAAAAAVASGGHKRGALSSSISRGQVRTGSGLAQQFRPTPAQRLTRPTRPVPLPVTSHPGAGTTWVGTPGSSQLQPSATVTSGQPVAARQSDQQKQLQQQLSPQSKGAITTSVTGTQRITTYHYSSGTTRLSESYLQRLVAEQKRESTSEAATAAATPPGDTNVNYRREPSSVSPQSSLI